MACFGLFACFRVSASHPMSVSIVSIISLLHPFQCFSHVQPNDSIAGYAFAMDFPEIIDFVMSVWGVSMQRQYGLLSQT